MRVYFYAMLTLALLFLSASCLAKWQVFLWHNGKKELAYEGPFPSTVHMEFWLRENTGLYKHFASQKPPYVPKKGHFFDIEYSYGGNTLLRFVFIEPKAEKRGWLSVGKQTAEITAWFLLPFNGKYEGVYLNYFTSLDDDPNTPAEHLFGVDDVDWAGEENAEALQREYEKISVKLWCGPLRWKGGWFRKDDVYVHCMISDLEVNLAPAAEEQQEAAEEAQESAEESTQQTQQSEKLTSAGFYHWAFNSWRKQWVLQHLNKVIVEEDCTASNGQRQTYTLTMENNEVKLNGTDISFLPIIAPGKKYGGFKVVNCSAGCLYRFTINDLPLYNTHKCRANCASAKPNASICPCKTFQSEPIECD
ncbi:MAG: hypothetical protein J7L14_01700 [Candidatus Diapherotrites archaeon]|nr:hypothetical protein [Candidatus Diapherotrites archaeon]